jgi:hypothetical protein
MLGGKKKLETKLMFFKYHLDTETFKYVQTHRKYDQSMNNQTFRAFKYNFQASLIQLSQHSPQD